MTLLEVTVVILVLMSLIAILFIGTSGWRRGADRSACVLNIRNAQTAVRAYQNSRDMREGTALDMPSLIIGSGKLLQNPTCPGGGDYLLIDHFPFAGELVIQCSLGGSEAHVPDNTGGW